MPLEDKSFEVFVIQERWHTGIVFRTQDVDPEIWPEIEMYNDRSFVDVGWGDEKFYQATGDPVLLAIRAIFWPTPSVLQIFAFSTPLRSAYGMQSRILRIPLSREEFYSLKRFVAESYKRDNYGAPQTSEAFGETDHYFLAHKRYHLFRTCNTWVAIAFKEAGLDVRTFCILNANQLFRQLSGLTGAEYMD